MLGLVCISVGNRLYIDLFLLVVVRVDITVRLFLQLYLWAKKDLTVTWSVASLSSLRSHKGENEIFDLF